MQHKIQKIAGTCRRLLKTSAVRYLLIGFTAFGVDYLVLIGSYHLLGLPLRLATAVGFVVGLLISFLANRYWVFGTGARRTLLRQSVEYGVLLVYNFFFTVWGVNFLNEHGIGPEIGKLLVMSLIMCWNYALFRWVIFAEKSKSTSLS